MKIIKFKFILTSVVLLLFFPILSSSVNAAVLFHEDFESSNLLNWQRINGTWDTIADPTNNHWVENLDLNKDNEIQAGDFSWTNYTFSVDIKQIAGSDSNIFFRVNNQRSTGLAFANHDLPVGYGLHISGSLVELQKWMPTEGSLLSSTLAAGTVSHVSIFASGSNVKIYINNSSVPSIDYTDNDSPILSGRIALAVIPGQSSQVWFDNVEVTDLPTATPTPVPTPISTPLPNLDVRDVKQFFLPWGTQTYDTANFWSSNPFISRWGCALTSADMILQYYGFSADPGQLNTWLKSQPDGYIGNGLLNWLAISRYSKLNSDTARPSLEFLRLGNTNQNLINELTNNRPAILEELGHYVVAKSQTNTSFGINDPAYSDRPTLDSYGNTFLSVESYVPSHTDLSYIMLTIDPGFDLKVFDTNGNEITGNIFIQSPLIDDIDGSSTSGNPIKIFEFPKPVNGIYKVQINGSGIYQLGSYLYDVNGNVNLTKTDGILGNGQIDEFLITIGQNDSTKQNVTIDQILQDLDLAKNQGKIKSDRVYDQIKITLKLVSGLIKSSKIKLAKIGLLVVNQLLKAYTPKFIDKDVSQILQNEVATLSETL